MKECAACGDAVSNLYKGTCLRCYDLSYATKYRAKYPNAIRAHNKVWTAIWQGKLPHLGRVYVACVDCGGEATQYDHRDYLKPLEVDPVCRSCNKRRGPGLHRDQLLASLRTMKGRSTKRARA